ANEALGHPADARDYTAAAQMLAALGHTAIDLLSNNPDKAAQLETLGITVAGRRPTGVFAGDANRKYLATKVQSTGHTIDLPLPLLAA
ncbi:MAG TPA: GTP cyclohydrolase, partial [Naasia sp.]